MWMKSATTSGKKGTDENKFNQGPDPPRDETTPEMDKSSSRPSPDPHCVAAS